MIFSESASNDSVLLSIIIVNYNGKKFLDECLASIEKNILFPHEVIIVDNASSDDSVEYLKSAYPKVTLIESDSNLGFTGGNNLGASYATSKYLLLLNNDTVIMSSLAPLIKILDSDDQIGILGCRLCYGDGRQQESVGYIPSMLSLVLSWTPCSRLFQDLPLCRRTVRDSSMLYNQSNVEVEWVSGAFLITRSDLWETLDGLDEKYFMYMEDTDYCRRAHESNYKVVYSADCNVIHYEGAGRSWIGERALSNTADSYIIYVEKFYGKIHQALLRLLLPIIFFARSFVYFVAANFHGDPVRKEKASAYWRVALSILFNCGRRSQIVLEKV
mgnify:CR=1 FL=1